jgi:hypothetical protein
MKSIQLESNFGENNELLGLVVKGDLQEGWYTVKYNGVRCESGTIVSAEYNEYGEIDYSTKE